jgi:catalase
MTYRHHGAQPVYAPNSYGGPRADPSKELPTWRVEAAEIGRYANEHHAEDDDVVQPRGLYQQVMDETDREHLATNIVAHAGDGVAPETQQRVVAYWTNLDHQLGERVAAGLGIAHADGRASGAARQTI